MALKIRIFIDWLTDQLIGWLVGRLIDLSAIAGIKGAFYSFLLSRGRVILINDRPIGYGLSKKRVTCSLSMSTTIFSCYRSPGCLETRGNLRHFGYFIWNIGQAAQICNFLPRYLVKTCSTPIANTYFIGRLVPPF